MMIEYLRNLYKNKLMYINKQIRKIIKSQPVWAFFIDFICAFIYILFGYKITPGFMN